MRRRRQDRWAPLILSLVFLLGCVVAGLTAASAVLHPRTDSPQVVDGIVVVAGAQDERYAYANHLAAQGVSDSILISHPADSATYGARHGDHCAPSPVVAPDGRRIRVACFVPDIDTTEGEATAATRIAREQGWESLLVVTYWGHVSRARIYFEQCFDGVVYVTDTPRPTAISRRDALLHEVGGYVKAFLKPAC